MSDLEGEPTIQEAAMLRPPPVNSKRMSFPAADSFGSNRADGLQHPTGYIENLLPL
jgi:hypothetical protein